MHNHCQRLFLEHVQLAPGVVVPHGTALLPVPPPGPETIPQPPGFPLNGARTVTFHLQNDPTLSAGIIGDLFVYTYDSFGNESTDGVNRGPIAIGAEITFTLTNVEDDYIQLFYDKCGGGAVLGFLRILGSQ